MRRSCAGCRNGWLARYESPTMSNRNRLEFALQIVARPNSSAIGPSSPRSTANRSLVRKEAHRAANITAKKSEAVRRSRVGQLRDSVVNVGGRPAPQPLEGATKIGATSPSSRAPASTASLWRSPAVCSSRWCLASSPCLWPSVTCRPWGPLFVASGVRPFVRRPACLLNTRHSPSARSLSRTRHVRPRVARAFTRSLCSAVRAAYLPRVSLFAMLAAVLRLEAEREMSTEEVARLLAIPAGRRLYRPIRRTDAGWVCRRVDLAAKSDDSAA